MKKAILGAVLTLVMLVNITSIPFVKAGISSMDEESILSDYSKSAYAATSAEKYAMSTQYSAYGDSVKYYENLDNYVTGLKWRNSTSGMNPYALAETSQYQIGLNDFSHLIANKEDFALDEKDFGKRGLYIQEKIKSMFWNYTRASGPYSSSNRKRLATEYPLTKIDINSYAYLWGYGALQTMTVANYQANPDSTEARDFMQEVNLWINTYRAPQNNANPGGGRYETLDRYLWDDNHNYYTGAISQGQPVLRFPGLTGADLQAAEAQFRDDNRTIMKIEDGASSVLKKIPIVFFGANDGGGDPYYDDNIWCVMALFEAAQLLAGDMTLVGDNIDQDPLGRTNPIEKYGSTFDDRAKLFFDWARGAMMYVLSGWDSRAGGGILWKDQTVTKNSCINTPAIVACTMFYDYYKSAYKEAEEANNSDKMVEYEREMRFWKNWAKGIYAWTRDHLTDTTDFLLWDSMNPDTGVINDDSGWKFAYNAGCMLSAAVRLHEICFDDDYFEGTEAYTGQYMRDAERLIASSYRFFVTRDANFAPGLDMYNGDVWFTLYLLRGYMDYSNATSNFYVGLDKDWGNIGNEGTTAQNYGRPRSEKGARFDGYMDRMSETLNYAWHNARNYYGLLKTNWTDCRVNHSANEYSELLRTAAGGEVLAFVKVYYDHPDKFFHYNPDADDFYSRVYTVFN